MTTFTVKIDWDRDGVFTTAGDDISADVMSVETSLGNYANDPLKRIAATGKATILVKSIGGKYSPANTSGPLYGKLLPNRPVQIQADGVPVFYGYTQTYTPAPGQYETQVATIRCQCILGKLQDAFVALPLQEDQTPKRILEKICASALEGSYATGSLQFVDTPANARAVVIAGRTYTYKTTLTGVANEILIDESPFTDGYTKDHAAYNLVRAINLEDGAGTNYGTGTTRHPYVTAMGYDSIGTPVGYMDTQFNLRETSGYDGLATSITPDDDCLIDRVRLMLKRIGTPTGTLTLQIQYAALGSPSEALCHANATATFAEASVAGDWGWIEFTLAGDTPLYSGMVYYVTLATNRAASGTNYIQWGADVDGTSGALLTGTNWVTLLYTGGGGMIIWVPGKVEITANAPGAWGNGLDLSVAGSEINESGAALSGGTDEPSGLTDFDTGLNVIELAGDTWRAGETNAMAAIKDVVDTEFGWLWVSPDGKLTFRDRDWFFERQSVASTLILDNTHMDQAGELNASRILNHMTVTSAPRVEAASGVIARANRSIEVKPGIYKRTSASEPYTVNTVIIPLVEDATGQVVGATHVIVPYPGTDYTVTDKAEGFSDDYTGHDYSAAGLIGITMAVTGAGVELTFSNSAAISMYINDLQVRGTALISRQPEQVVESDAASISAYSRRSRNYHLPFDTSAGMVLARAIAKYLVDHYKDPTYAIDNVLLKTTSPHTVNGVSVFDLDIGDVSTLTETQTGVTGARSVITAIEHTIDTGGNKVDTRLFLLALNAGSYWVLAHPTYGVLGTTTRLGLGGSNYDNGYADGSIVGVVDFNRALRDDVGDLFYSSHAHYMHFHDESIVTVGNALTTVISAASQHNFYSYQNAGAVGDTTTFSCVLSPGRYQLITKNHFHTNGAVISILINDTSYVARSYDTYSAGTYNATSSFPFETTELKRHKFEIVTVGKRAASGGYENHLTSIMIRPL